MEVKPRPRLWQYVVVSTSVWGLLALTWVPLMRPARAEAVTSAGIVELTNLERLKRGLAPLTADPLLERAAVAKANDMVAGNYFAHYHGTTTPWQFILGAGATDWLVAGENLAKNYRAAGPLLTAWMNSELHRANILNPAFDRIGVAVVTVPVDGIPITLTVQLFTG